MLSELSVVLQYLIVSMATCAMPMPAIEVLWIAPNIYANPAFMERSAVSLARPDCLITHTQKLMACWHTSLGGSAR